MKNWNWLYVLLLLGLFMVPQSVSHAQATGVCEVYDTANLFDGDVCANAQAFNNQGIDVYIFTTDVTPRNVEEWYAIIDAFEEEHAFRGGGLRTSALVIEIDAENQYSLITTGDDLWYKLGSPDSLGKYSNQLVNKIDQVGFTHGVTEFLDYFYAVSYPPATPVPPTPIPAPVVQKTEVHETNIDFGPLVKGVGIGLVILVLAAGGYYLFILVIKPVMNNRNRRQVLLLQLEKLQKQTRDLMFACHGEGQLGLLAGNTAKGTLLYTLWASNGGAQYTTQDAELVADLERAMAAYEKARQIQARLLEIKDIPEDLSKLEELVLHWEELLGYITGNSERILNMTALEQAQLLDPTDVVQREHIDDALLAQMEQTLRVLDGAGSLRITFMFLNPSSLEERGVLGNIDAIKTKLAALEQAREEAPKVLEQAESLRAQLAETLQVPEETTIESIFAPVDTLIAAATAAYENELWLNVTTQAHEAIEDMSVFENLVVILNSAWGLVAAIADSADQRIVRANEVQRPLFERYQRAIKHFEAGEYVQAQGVADDVVKLVPAVNGAVKKFETALKLHDQHVEHLADVKNQLFEITVADDELAEVEDDIRQFNAALKVGNAAEAERFISELTEDSQRAVAQVDALVALRKQNSEDLQRLSIEVARVQASATSVQAQWNQLSAYPATNWTAVDGFFEAATNVLKRLFDDPDNSDDLSSQIDKLNSFGVQNFSEAHRLLDGAFAELKDAEGKLKAVAAQYCEVKELEAELSERFGSVERDIQKARVRRDADNEKISREVDAMIDESVAKLRQSQEQFRARNFTVSADLLEEANRLANRAYAEAEAQATKIDGLYGQLVEVKARAERAVSAASQKQSYQQPVVRNAATAGLVNGSQDELRRAKTAEQKLAGLEDRNLEKQLEVVVSVYRSAAEKAASADRQLDADQSEYDRYVSSAQSAISSAESAISAAIRYTSDSDAGSAGDSALSRARRALPSAPQSGDTKSELDAKRRAAEEAERHADSAKSQAQAAIREVEEERERERQRQAAEARRRREAQEAADRAARQAREAEERRRRDSYTSSPTYHHSSGGSISHRVSGGGGVHRSSGGGGRHR